MYLVHIEDEYHLVKRGSPHVTLCRLSVPIHSIAISPVHCAHMVTCIDCKLMMQDEETDTRPVTALDDE